MKNQIRKVQHRIKATALLTTALSTTASLIQSKVLAFKQAGSFGDINGVNENALSTAVFYKSYPNGTFFRGKTTTASAFYSGII